MNNFYLFITCAIFFVACADESTNLHNENLAELKQENSVNVVQIIDGNILPLSTRSLDNSVNLALSFTNESDFIKFKNELSSKSNWEKKTIVSKIGITTLHKVSDSADEELEALGKQAHSEDEFRNLYNQYKEKYNGILLSNLIDSTDLSLYVPEGDKVESFICNSNGQIVVGNKIKTIHLANKVSPSVEKASKAFIAENQISTAEVMDINTSVFRPISNKKIYFNAYLVGQNVWVQMYAKKHMWYGWKNDPHRNYYFSSFLNSNFEYLAQGKYGQEIVVQRLPMYIFNQNVSDGFNIILGRITTAEQITGHVKIWTDLTSERDINGNELTENINGMTCPKCLDSKAHIVRIILPK
ncbi:DUF4848 domain-containing protein [Bacteroides graminisolvens]